MLPTVMGAEQQLPRIGEHNAYVCLGTTPIAQVRRIERPAWCESSGHVASLASCHRSSAGGLCPTCYSTLCQAHAFPCGCDVRPKRTPAVGGWQLSSPDHCSGGALSQVAGYVPGVASPGSRTGRLVCRSPPRFAPPGPLTEENHVTAVRADTDGPAQRGSAGRGPGTGRTGTGRTGTGRTGRAAAPLASLPAGDAYTARHLSVLEGLEAVRKRPGMYIGSTDERGLMHCLWEIFDNSVDEALGGHCTSIDVVLHPDMSAEVRDNGRGIPVDVEPKSGLTGIELVMTRLHAGGKFGGGSYTASGGLHGVGASVVNALSARLDVQVDREGHEWTASFRRGVPGEFATAGPQASLSRGAGLRQTRKVPRKVTGTRIRFWPDRQVFTKDADWVFDALVDRARQTAYLVPGLTIRVRDERPAMGQRSDPSVRDGAGSLGDRRGSGPVAEKEAEFRFDGGISEFCEYLSPGQAMTDVLRLTGAGRFSETVPVLDEQGHMTPTDVERELQVDAALQWNTGYDTVTRSFVNVIATPKGGTHVTGFERALVKTLNTQLRAARILKNGDEPVTKEDVLEGLTT